MQIVRLSDADEKEVNAPLFTGPVFRTDAESNVEGPYQASVVRFSHGVRNKFHTHSTDQILVITDGTGIVATEDEQFDVKVGDVVMTPAGEKHWHGATPGSEMAHITITGTGSSTDQVEP